MEKISVAEAAALAKGVLIGDGGANISSVEIDSRKVGKGSLFVALPGEKADGHDYVKNAAANGAAAALCSRECPDAGIPVILADDTAAALARLAAGYRARFKIPVIGITGSVGKTTAREMTSAVLSAKYKTFHTEGNFNNHLGLPLMLTRLDSSYEAAVLEMGMSALGEISFLTRIAKPDAAVITNIGVSHIGMLGSRENILRAKLEIMEGLPDGGPIVLNGDEPLLRNAEKTIERPVVTFGVKEKDCSLFGYDIESMTDKTSFSARLSCDMSCATAGTEMRLTVPSPGEHSVMNALAAVSVGLLQGLSPEEAAKGLAAFKLPPMRLRIYEKKGYTVIEDCYNASPDSVAAALRVLAGMKGRKIAALGGIRELGERSRELHRECGRLAAGAADELYLFGEGAEWYAEGALETGMKAENVRIFDSREKLAASLAAGAPQGAAVLFKGSRYMKMEEALSLFLGGDAGNV